MSILAGIANQFCSNHLCFMDGSATSLNVESHWRTILKRLVLLCGCFWFVRGHGSVEQVRVHRPVLLISVGIVVTLGNGARLTTTDPHWLICGDKWCSVFQVLYYKNLAVKTLFKLLLLIVIILIKTNAVSEILIEHRCSASILVVISIEIRLYCSIISCAMLNDDDEPFQYSPWINSGSHVIT